MKLRFLGTGGAFAKTHTNAFFYNEKEEGRDLFLLDLSMLNVQKTWKLVEDKAD